MELDDRRHEGGSDEHQHPRDTTEIGYDDGLTIEDVFTNGDFTGTPPF